ncbi:MAG: prepilin-type N-terminal cleavage/methylation domain-containing protein [Candidatus Paceibacterota bacterium]
MSSLFSNKRFFHSRGFTLVELMVTIGIFVFMTVLTLAKYNNFYSGTIFTNLAYDIALTIRQAQTYGLSVKVVDTGTPTFGSAYGVRFKNIDTTEAKKFGLYSYTRVSGTYVPALEKNYNIKRGAYVSKLCTDIACTFPITGTVDVIFQRPNPEAIICVTPSIGSYTCTDRYIKIEITSSDGSATHTIEVNSVGQILVN